MTLDELIKKAQSPETPVETEEQEKVAEQLTPEEVADLLGKTASEVVEEPTEEKKAGLSPALQTAAKIVGGAAVCGTATGLVAKKKMGTLRKALPEVTTPREMNIMQDYIERAYELGKQMAVKRGKGA